MAFLMRDARASYDGRHLVASLKPGQLTIWKTNPQEELMTVEPGFDTGSSRHAFDPINRIIYAGVWEGGLTAYDLDTRKALWRRDDLVGIQTVDLSGGFPSSVFLTLEAPDHRVDEPGVESGILELDAATGETRWFAEAGDWLFLSPVAPILVLEDRADRVIRLLGENRKEIVALKALHFAVIDVAFSGDLLAIAEGSQGVRVVDRKGRVVSRYVPKRSEPYCRDVAFDQGRLCVGDSSAASWISIVDPQAGALISEYQRGHHGSICFIDAGARFVDTSGTIFRTQDGEIVGSLNPNTGEEVDELARGPIQILPPVVPP